MARPPTELHPCNPDELRCIFKSRSNGSRPCHALPVSDPTQPEMNLSDDRRKHLEFIQAAVSRMAGGSALAKSWLLPVVTATYGYALANRLSSIAFLGVAAVLLFATLDAQYLRQERAFRALYRAASEGRVTTYEMANSSYYNKPNGDEEDKRSENCGWDKVVFSWSLAGFYGPVVLFGLGVAAWTKWCH